MGKDSQAMEMEQQAEKRMTAECDCQPQTEIRYHTVPFMHTDSYALDILAGLMTGRTGRLYKAMVLGSVSHKVTMGAHVTVVTVR